MRNLMIALLALLGALIAVEYNQYSHCKEWRLELGLRDQGIAPERSWSRAAVLFAGGLLLAIYFGSGQLLLDALALLPWIVQLAFWTIVFFGLGKGAGLAARAALFLVRGRRRGWRHAAAAPLIVQS